MSSKLICVLRGAIIFFTIVLASLGIIYVLDVIPSEEMQDALGKSIKIVGILTASSIVYVLLSSIGSRSSDCSSKQQANSNKPDGLN